MNFEDSLALGGLSIVITDGWLEFTGVNPLELACLSLCREARGHVPRAVRVDKRTPISLWYRVGDGNGHGKHVVGMNRRSSRGGKDDHRDFGEKYDSQAPSLRGSLMTRSERFGELEAPRIPEVHQLQILLYITPSEFLIPGLEWTEGVRRLWLLGGIWGSLRRAPLPQGLEELVFSPAFNSPLGRGGIMWPRGLKRLRFGPQWNQALTDARETWPASIERLEFGSCFNHPLGGDGVGLPVGIRHLVFGERFDQSLSGVEWPPGLEVLIFGNDFNRPLVGVKWPRALRILRFGHAFNQELAEARFPPSLEELDMGVMFTRPLQEGKNGPSYLPSGLKVLWLGMRFAGRIGAWTLPRGLEEFHCRGHCAFPPLIEWPPGLKILDGPEFMPCLEGGRFVRGERTLPPRLEELEVIGDHGGWVEDVEFPSTLRVLKFGGRFDEPVDLVVLPGGLEELHFGASFQRDIRGLRLPRSLKVLTFDESAQFNVELKGIELPENLEMLRFGEFFDQSLEGIKLPPHLKKICFGRAFRQSLLGAELPGSLKVIRLSTSYSPLETKALMKQLNHPGSMWFKADERSSLKFELRRK